MHCADLLGGLKGLCQGFIPLCVGMLAGDGPRLLALCRWPLMKKTALLRAVYIPMMDRRGLLKDQPSHPSSGPDQLLKLLLCWARWKLIILCPVPFPSIPLPQL